MRVAIGCATTITSLLAMVLLFMLTLYLDCTAILACKHYSRGRRRIPNEAGP
jgi:hypothetical protein